MSQTSRFEADATPEREAYLLIRHVAGTLIQELAAALEPSGITPEQYHILRILRDASPDGLPCSAVAQRAVSGDPDVTRLLDRLEAQQWAIRTREAADRRVVTARITTDGKRLLAKLEKTVAELHANQFDDLGVREVSTLRGLLERVAQPRSD
jgi:DNA-binding MarR family transcriptional regulator